MEENLKQNKTTKKKNITYYKFLNRLPRVIRIYLLKRMASKEGGEWLSNSLREYYRLTHNIEVGIGTYGCFYLQNFQNHCTIGNYCSIADTIRRFNGNHPLNECVMHPIFYDRGLAGKGEGISRVHLTIGNDVWIGSDVVILPGCRNIGDGAVIGAGSILTKDVEPYAIVCGNPAHVLKKRFSKEIIAKLEECRWWDLQPKELINFYEYRKTPDVFCSMVMEYKKESICNEYHCKKEVQV